MRKPGMSVEAARVIEAAANVVARWDRTDSTAFPEYREADELRAALAAYTRPDRSRVAELAKGLNG